MNLQADGIEFMVPLVRTVVTMQIHEEVAPGACFRRTLLMDIYLVRVSKRAGSMLNPSYDGCSTSYYPIVEYFQRIAVSL